MQDHEIRELEDECTGFGAPSSNKRNDLCVTYTTLKQHPKAKAILSKFDSNVQSSKATIAEKIHFEHVYSIEYDQFFGSPVVVHNKDFSYLDFYMSMYALHKLTEEKVIEISSFDTSSVLSNMKTSFNDEIMVPGTGTFVISFLNQSLEIILTIYKRDSFVDCTFYTKTYEDFGKFDIILRDASIKYSMYEGKIFTYEGDFLEVSEITFDDIFLEGNIRKEVKENIIDYVDSKEVEIKIKNGLPTKRGLILVGMPGTGKCIVGSTRIVDVKTGEYLKVEEWFKRSNLNVVGVDGKLKLASQRAKILNNGIKSCYELTTKYGRKITLTKNHPLLTLEGWQSLENLRVGDYIAVPRKLNIGHSAILPEHEIRLLGFFIGDGCTTTAASFSNNNKKIIQQFKRDIKTLSPLLYVHDTKTEVDHNVYTRSRPSPIKVFLRKYNLFGKHSYEKNVPNIIFQLPKDQIALFLNSLYACDGSVYQTSNGVYPHALIEYSTTSKELIYGVQHLLLRFGICGNVTSRKSYYKVKGKKISCRVSYRLTITDANGINTFIKEIGARGKTEKVFLRNVTQSNQQYTIPIFSYIKNLPGFEDIEGISNIKGRKQLRETLSRESVGKFAIKLNNVYLKNLAEADVVWHQIKSIEYAGKQQTYDLSVNDIHNFIADDIVVHNSFLCKILANTLKTTFMVVTNLSNIYGLQRIFKFASKFKRIIILFEDIDIYIGDRDFGSALLPTMLNELDGMQVNNNVIVLCTTNDIESLDEALKNRPGRFDRILKFNPPNNELKIKMLEGMCKDKNVSNVDFKKVAENIPDKYTGAHIKEIYITACNDAIKQKSLTEDQIVLLTTDTFLNAINHIKEKIYNKNCKSLGFKNENND